MAISKQKKEEIVSKTGDAISGSDSVVFVNFHGLGVSDTTKLRSTLREQGVGYMVAKKSLVKRALDSAKIEGNTPALDGELAIAYLSAHSAQAGAHDLIAPAREIYNFQKEYKDKIAILGGVFEGRYMDQSEMTTIASIPPLQVLRGQFVNLINSPVQRFAVVLDQIAAKREV